MVPPADPDASHHPQPKRQEILNECGVPDFVILWRRNVILVEAKTRTGKLSLYQRDWKHLAEVNGFPVHIIRSYEEFLKLVEEIKTRAEKA